LQIAFVIRATLGERNDVVNVWLNLEKTSAAVLTRKSATSQNPQPNRLWKRNSSRGFWLLAGFD
jgi:hypothetical protein